MRRGEDLVEAIRVSPLKRGETEYLVTSTNFPNLFAKESRIPSNYLVNKKAQQQTSIEQCSIPLRFGVPQWQDLLIAAISTKREQPQSLGLLPLKKVKTSANKGPSPFKMSISLGDH